MVPRFPGVGAFQPPGVCSSLGTFLSAGSALHSLAAGRVLGVDRRAATGVEADRDCLRRLGCFQKRVAQGPFGSRAKTNEHIFTPFHGYFPFSPKDGHTLHFHSNLLWFCPSFSCCVSSWRRCTTVAVCRTSEVEGLGGKTAASFNISKMLVKWSQGKGQA